MSSTEESDLGEAHLEGYDVEFFLLVDRLNRPGFTQDELRDSMEGWGFPEELQDKVETIYEEPSADLVKALRQASTEEEFLALDVEGVA